MLSEALLARFLRSLAGICDLDPTVTMRTVLRSPERKARLKVLIRQFPVDENETFYSVGEAAKLFKVSIKTVDRWIKAGKMRCAYTRGGHRRISEGEIRRVNRSRMERGGKKPRGVR